MTDYNSNRVSVILREKRTGRVHAASGFASDSRVEVDEANDDITIQKGSDGEYTFSHSNDDQGSMAMTLMQQSDTNDFLDDMLQKQKRVGAGKISILVKDNNGRSLHRAAEARVAGPPAAPYDKEAGSREWNIKVPEWNENSTRGIS